MWLVALVSILCIISICVGDEPIDSDYEEAWN